jgi:uncharacterized protein with HEPN domain
MYCTSASASRGWSSIPRGGENEFFRDEKTQDAVVRNLQIMAESCNRLSDETREAHPEVNWRQIAGFRNVVVHDYFGLNMRTIWEIVTGDLPDLKRHIAAMLGS